MDEHRGSREDREAEDRLIGSVPLPTSTAEPVQRDLQEPWIYFLRAAARQPRATKAAHASVLAHKAVAAQLTELLGVAERQLSGVEVELARRRKRAESQRDLDEALRLIQYVRSAAETQGMVAAIRSIGLSDSPGGPAFDAGVKAKLERLKDLGQLLAIACKHADEHASAAQPLDRKG